jgi:two-component system sensor histidine kinase UhpB
MPLLWRVFATNAAVLAAGVLLLVLTPATVSFPVELAEVVLVTAGFGVLLAVDWTLLRRLLGRLQLERDSARRVLAAQEAERQRIARELHDQVGQMLTAVLLQLDRAHRTTPAAEIEEAREAVRETLDDVRALARLLRPEALDDLGLPAALVALTSELSRRAGVPIDCRLQPGIDLTPEQELVVYRVAQEALTNGIRHGAARRAWLALRDGSGPVTLEVGDDGAGFDPATTERGTGLLGMSERAALIGARLDVESSPGHGTRVRLRIGGT